MGKQIVTISIGQCGNCVGKTFWETLAQEHGLQMDGVFGGNSLQEANVGVYFQQSNKKYAPRALMIDLEPSVLNGIMNQNQFYKNTNFVAGKKSAANCFAASFMGEQGIEESVQDLIRKELDECDNLLYFNYLQAVGGGTSGFACKLAQHIADVHAKKGFSYSVFPANDLSYSCTEGYNTLLCSHEFTKVMDCVYMFDNQTIADICTETLGQENASFGDFNKLIALFMANITAPIRFPTQLSTSPRKLIHTLLPESGLKFLTTSLAPLQNKSVVTAKSLVRELFHEKNFLMRCEKNSKIISTALIYRGCNTTSLYDAEVKSYVSDNPDRFVDWMPHNVSASFCDVPDYLFSPQSGCRVTVSGHTSAILDAIVNNSKNMFLAGFNLHWFTSEGFTEEQFEEAFDNLIQLSAKYDVLCGTEEGKK